MPGLQNKARPALSLVILTLVALTLVATLAAQQQRRFLYVGVPGTDADVESHDAVGILVFDIDSGHRFVRRISPWAKAAVQGREQVRGIASHVATGRLYLSTVERLAAIDLKSERVLWEKSYEGHCCDRFALSPDGRTIYVPAFGKPLWYVIDAMDGRLITTLQVTGFPRQTIYSRDGRRAYLAAWESRVLSVVDTATHRVIREVGPFSDSVCPVTLNSRETLAFVNVDGLVGFEVGDLQTGLVLDRVAVEDSNSEAWEEYECPSHGIAMTGDGRELWITDGVDNRLHIFDATMYPPVLTQTLEVSGKPRWIAFSRDAMFAYASNGDVMDRAARKVVARLMGEDGALVQSERMVEVTK
jgi:hypothetical protein